MFAALFYYSALNGCLVASAKSTFYQSIVITNFNLLVMHGYMCYLAAKSRKVEQRKQKAQKVKKSALNALEWVFLSCIALGVVIALLNA